MWPTVAIAVDTLEESFQDDVSLASLAADPFIQVAFAAWAVAVLFLFGAKAVVTQMDGAVEEVAADFDRMMTLKYAKKWEKMIGADGSGNEDRTQRVVEAMERLKEEDPYFVERVMRDMERLNK